MINRNIFEIYLNTAKSFSIKTLLISVVLIVLSGCATDSARTEAQGALLGAVAGGVIGKLIGEEKGAIAGAYFGSILGSKWGVHVASKKEDYANQETYFRDVITAAKIVESDAENYNKVVARKIDMLKLRKNELHASASNHRKQQQKLKNINTEIKITRNQTNSKIERVTQEIEIQKKVITAERKTASPQLLKVAAGGVSDLEIQQRALHRALAQLKIIDERRIY